MTGHRRAAAAIINTDDDVRRGIRSLRRKCEFIRQMHDLAGDPPLRRREPGFEGLARIIISQQVSVASATAIWTRFALLVQPMEALAVMDKTDAEMRSAGLSGPKVRTLRAASAAVLRGELFLDGFQGADEEAVHAALTSIPGIGPWTADIFLMSCMGHSDAFASRDLALQEAARIILNLDRRPNHSELLVIAERWRPWRAVAARLLWSYYHVIKKREGMT